MSKTKPEEMSQRQWFQTWYVVSLFTSFLQACFFTAWVFVLLGLLDAPFWGYAIGVPYVLAHWVYWISLTACNLSRKNLDKDDTD